MRLSGSDASFNAANRRLAKMHRQVIQRHADGHDEGNTGAISMPVPARASLGSRRNTTPAWIAIGGHAGSATRRDRCSGTMRVWHDA
jgi:hypothetical protein